LMIKSPSFTHLPLGYSTGLGPILGLDRVDEYTMRAYMYMDHWIELMGTSGVTRLLFMGGQVGWQIEITGWHIVTIYIVIIFFGK